MFKHSLLIKELPQSLRLASIKVLPKENKDPDDPASYRPISIQNTDCKILAKLLAARLNHIVPKIVGRDQTGFVLNRQSYSNIRRLLGILQYIKSKKLDALVVSLDAEKAFDHIEWEYLFKTLKEYAFGDRFINCVKLLYSAPQATVSVNGLMSSPFSITRGTKQGCPLSPLLFALAMVPLAEMIRCNTSVAGIRTEKKST